MRGTDSRVAGWLGGVKVVTLIFTSLFAPVTLVFFSFSCSAGRILWI